MTVAGLGTGDPASVPIQTREMLANADYVIGSPAALSVARRWIRSVELPLHADNREGVGQSHWCGTSAPASGPWW